MKDDRALHAALRKVAADVRSEGTPDLDWERLEASLEARLDGAARRAPARPQRTPIRFAALSLAAIAACSAVLFFATRPSPVQGRAAIELTTTEVVEIVPAWISGAALALGAPVVAGASPLSVEHEGHVTWTLDAGSRAHLESTGRIVTVALDQGALEARVTKSILPESFAVRVEHTRIAVHGTYFRVERAPTGVRVELREGVVSVGRVGEPGVRIQAPSTVLLDLEGARTDLVMKGPSRPPAVAPSHEPPAAPVIAADGHAPLPATASMAQVIEAVTDCVAQHTVSRGDLKVTIGTKVSLRVDPAGSVAESRFDPPLAPAVGRCVETRVAGLEFERTPEGFALEQRLELGR